MLCPRVDERSRRMYLLYANEGMHKRTFVFIQSTIQCDRLAKVTMVEIAYTMTWLIHVFEMIILDFFSVKKDGHHELYTVQEAFCQCLKG